MKKLVLSRRRVPALLCAAALLLLPLGTGAGRIEDLRGVAYVVEGKKPTPIQPASNQNQSSGKLNSLVSNGVIKVSDLERVAEDYSSVPQDFLSAISGRSTITLERFEDYAVEYQLPGQYVQRFIDDHFIFKKGNSFEYLPVEKDATKHSYDWDNLVHYSREKDYVVNGVSRVLKGIDVSVFQGNINWNAVKADGVDFAFIRLGYRGYTNGAVKLDNNFHQNIQGAQAAGIKVGVYFYSQAVSRSEAIEEAQFCLDELSGYSLEMPVVFDLEGGANSSYRTYGMSTATAARMVSAFCDTIESGGYKSMYYSYAKFLAEHSGLVAQLEDYDLWMAMYYRVPFFPYNFKIWQYTSSGSVSGISGGVDMNMLFLDYIPS